MGGFLPEQEIDMPKQEFSSTDPRTPSIFSSPGIPLSYENERKVREAASFQQQFIQGVIRRGEEQRRKFWADKKNLQLRWEQLFDIWHQSTVFPEGTLWIEPGTGDVLLKNGKEFRNVDVIHDSLYVQPVATAMTKERERAFITFDVPLADAP